VRWRVTLDPDAIRDFDDLDGVVQKRVSKFLYERVTNLEDPRSIGEALRGSTFGDYWKYRVGDYRVVARILDRVVEVIVVRVGHRREVYRRR
jgi:mRNA interferase RelE/StbE